MQEYFLNEFRGVDFPQVVFSDESVIAVHLEEASIREAFVIEAFMEL